MRSIYQSWLDRSRVLRWLEYWYPFSFAGSLLFACVIWLTGLAYAADNLYAQMLALLAFVILTALLFVCRLQAFRLGDPDIVWKASQSLVSRHSGGGFEIGTGEFGIFYFLRLHFRIHGRQQAGQ